MPQPGEVFVFRQFEFEDGSRRDKWFVALNASDSETPCLVLKTTSQPKRYQGCIEGCNHDRRCFYAPIGWNECFEADTYVQLPQILPFGADELLRAGFAANLDFKGRLTQRRFAQLLQCLAGFRDQIAPVHRRMIFPTQSKTRV
jgi:hypothetical protein